MTQTKEGTHFAEIVGSLARSHGHRAAADATSVLLVLASTPHPLTRRDLGERLGIATTTLSKSIIFLECHGLIVSTRRFGITLGVRFLDNTELSRILRDTTLALATPHLDFLVHKYDVLSAIALPTEGSVIIAELAGHTPPGYDAEAFHSVLSAVVHPSHADGMPAALALRGLWTGAAGPDTVAIGSRVRLAGSSAVLGVAVRIPTVAQFSELSNAVLHEANVLTSAFRRVYPTPSHTRDRG